MLQIVFAQANIQENSASQTAMFTKFEMSESYVTETTELNWSIEASISGGL